MNTEKETQEKLKAQKETDYQKLKIDCAEKDLQKKKKEKKQEILSREMDEIKKMHNETIEKLQNDCFQKDLQMKEQERKQKILNLQIKDQEKLLEILKTENALLHRLPAEANAASGNPLDTDIILDCC
ncbi:uncharacterized protein [Palaemon carinicauda]|uniref:uncharacterized protein n=1 Tax=Palaemon carinicauda TaxID=392227 RepID=UPI0035B5CADE